MSVVFQFLDGFGGFGTLFLERFLQLPSFFLVVSRRIREKRLPNVMCPGRETDQMECVATVTANITLACTGTALRTHRRVLINAVPKSHRGQVLSVSNQSLWADFD